MTIVSLLSAKGSPGVTTTSVALSLAWADRQPVRRTVLLDADPVGGDVAAGVLRGTTQVGRGVLALASGRGVAPAELLDAACVPLTEEGSVGALVGVPDSQRASALGPAWSVIEQVRADRDDLDLVVDAGRIDSAAVAGPWVTGSDLALLVVRPGLPWVAAARRLANSWAAVPATSGVPLALLVVDSPSPYSARDVAAAVGLPLAATIPFEPMHAQTYSAGAPASRGLGRSRFVRAVVGVADFVALQGATDGARNSRSRLAGSR